MAPHTPSKHRPRRGSLAALGLIWLVLGLGSCGRESSGPNPRLGELGELDAALRTALDASIHGVEQDPGSAQAWLDLAELYDANGLYRGAERCYTQAQSLAPQARTLYLLGRVHYELGDGAQAEADWKAVRELDPECVPVHWRLGQLELEGGQYAEALLDFDQALELHAGDSDASLGKARALFAMGRAQAAWDLLEVMLAGNKRNKRALNLAARTLERLGRPQEAERMARREQKAQVLPAGDRWLAEVLGRRVGAQVLLEQALAMMARGETPEAVRLLREQVERTPKNLGVWNLLLRGLVLEERFGEVLARSQRAHAYIEEHHLLLISEGRALMGLGQVSAAATRFQRAVELAPGFGEAHAALGEAQLRLGAYEAASDALGRATELEQTSVRDWLALGQAELGAKRYDDAARHLQGALRQYPLVPDLWALAAEAEIAAGQLEAARKSLVRLAKREPGHRRLGPLKERLAAAAD